MTDSTPVIAFSTCADAEKAQRIANALVEQHLAACVNIINNVKSTYRWQGKVSVDDETMLVIKTISQHLGRAQEVIRELSGYELPELVAVNISGGSAEYLKWLQAEC